MKLLNKDKRGYIKDLFDMPSNSVILIESKKGTIRANHYHKKDYHMCYIIYGKIKYHFKAKITDKKTKFKIYNKDETFFTPPKELHAMEFLEKTKFIAIARNKRDKKSYLSDTVPVNLI